SSLHTRCPRCTPFPYTTLFRSPARDSELVLAGRELDVRLLPSPGIPDDLPSVARCRRGVDDQDADRAAPRRLFVFVGPPSVVGEDRKSTRLNSSHQIISYAVFC